MICSGGFQFVFQRVQIASCIFNVKGLTTVRHRAYYLKFPPIPLPVGKKPPRTDGKKFEANRRIAAKLPLIRAIPKRRE